MKWLFGALVALTLGSVTYAQGLPDSVTEPYLKFEAAIRAGDVAAVLDAANRAYEAGQAADIDLSVLATLAENYGYGAALNQDYETAQIGWREAAQLSDRARGDPVERAWRWHNAALFALQNDDRSDAFACSRRATNALDELGGELGAASDFAGTAFLTRAALSMGRGRISSAGEAALQSAAAFEAVLDEPTSSYALALFYAGIAQTLDRDFEAATYSLHMATDVMEDVAPDHPDMRTMWAAYVSASGYIRERDIPAGEAEEAGGDAAVETAQTRVDARLAENPFHTARYMTREIEEDAAEDAHETGEPLPCCDAQPIRRREPSYPMNAAYSNLDGVVYLTFAVTEDGRTDAIEVTGAFPPGIFDEVSVAAVETWQYEPATRDGVPVRREGVETRFDFRMER